MNTQEVLRLRSRLASAMRGRGGPIAAADRLCHACVALLAVDGASISLVHQTSTQGTFGSSGALSRRLDEWQFTYGEGPCMEAVRTGSPVLVNDLGDPNERRWPAFTDALLGEGVRAVYAWPVEIASSWVGALDLFSHRRGQLSDVALTGALLAAELAALPLLDLMTLNAQRLTDARQLDTDLDQEPWEQLESLERVEVYQATGVLVAALDLSPAEALVRLRAHAFAVGMTASEVAYEILGRRLMLNEDPPANEDRSGDAGNEGRS